MKYPTLLTAIVALSGSFLWQSVLLVESGIPIDVTQQEQLRQPAMPSYSRGYPFSTAGIPLTYAAATKSAFSGTSSSSECILPRRGADRGGSLLRANPDTNDNKRADLFREDLLTSRKLIPASHARRLAARTPNTPYADRNSSRPIFFLDRVLAYQNARLPSSNGYNFSTVLI